MVSTHRLYSLSLFAALLWLFTWSLWSNEYLLWNYGWMSIWSVIELFYISLSVQFGVIYLCFFSLQFNLVCGEPIYCLLWFIVDFWSAVMKLWHSAFLSRVFFSLGYDCGLSIDKSKNWNRLWYRCVYIYLWFTGERINFYSVKFINSNYTMNPDPWVNERELDHRIKA